MCRMSTVYHTLLQNELLNCAEWYWQYSKTLFIWTPLSVWNPVYPNWTCNVIRLEFSIIYYPPSFQKIIGQKLNKLNFSRNTLIFLHLWSSNRKMSSSLKHHISWQKKQFLTYQVWRTKSSLLVLNSCQEKRVSVGLTCQTYYLLG